MPVNDDANLKLVEVVTVTDVDDVKRVGDNLVQIWKLKLVSNTNQLRP